MSGAPRAVLDPDTAASLRRCECGCVRAQHAREETDEGGVRHGRCRRCGWRTCPEFRLAGVDVEAELAEIAASTGTPIDVLREQWAAMRGAPIAGPEVAPPAAVSAVDEGPVDDGVLYPAELSAHLAEEFGQPGVTAGEVLDQWDGWLCEECGRRYRMFGGHGAPDPCAGVLMPITVTVTRRAA